jgi:hypothetical protein
MLSKGVSCPAARAPRTTRRVTLAAHLLQACSSPALTLSLHTCCSSLALTCPGLTHSYITAPRHTSAPVCLYAFGARPLTAFVALADHTGEEYS